MESSGVKWVRLGDYIEQCDERNTKEMYSVDDVRGISIEKRIIDTKANMDGVSVTNYKLYRTNYFCYVPVTSRNGNKITLALNTYDATYIVSSAYEVFRVKDEVELLPLYLFLFFLRPEFDRYARYNSWGSAREVFSWEDMCNILIPLPSVAEQQKVVNAWRAFREIKEQNEAKAAPLMQLCQSYIQEIRKKKNVRNYRIGNAIEVIDKTNKDGSPYEVLGLNNNKMFMPTVASMDTINTSKYKIIRKGEFAFSGMQTGRDKCIRIALYDKDIPALISPAYTTFILDKEEPILPEYFMMIFKNSEMDRLGWFYSDSSVRANLDWNRFIDIEIPLPPIEVQQAIVNIYKCANEAKLIAEEADRLSREVCPALLQHVIHS